MCSTHIKEHIPIRTAVSPSKPINLQRIHNTLILTPRNLIQQIRLFYRYNPIRLYFLNRTAFRIIEKHRPRPIFKPTFQLVRIIGILVFSSSCCLLLAVHINAIVQLLAVHPYALECLFAVRSEKVDGDLHAF